MIPSDEAMLMLDNFIGVCNLVIARANELPPARDEIERRVRYRYFFYLAKATNTFGAYSLLMRKGYSFEALVLSRANFELLVDLLYFDISPVDLSERFDDYWHIASELEIATVRAEDGTKCILASERLRIEELRQGFCKKYGHKKFPCHWSGIDKIYERAKKVGQERAYRTTYRIRSDFAHCGVSSAAHYISYADSVPEAEKMALDKIETHIEIGAACGEMLYCLKIIEAGLALSIYDVIHDLYEQYAEYSRKQLEDN